MRVNPRKSAHGQMDRVDLSEIVKDSFVSSSLLAFIAALPIVQVVKQ